MRSASLMSRRDSAVLLVDVQSKLVPSISNHVRIIAHCRFALEAAKLFGLPILATEQYSKGLGRTVDELADFAQEPIEKLAFSSAQAEGVVARLQELGVAKVLVIGIEAHVCVSQTAFDLQAGGFRPYVAADAVGSRHDEDKQTALRRFEQHGITVTTTEAAAFEWAETAAAAEFKAFSQLVKDKDVMNILH